MFRIAPLTAGFLGRAAGEFESFTYPRLRPLLARAGQSTSAAGCIAVGVWMGEQPAGLALYSEPWALPPEGAAAASLPPGIDSADAADSARSPEATPPKDRRRLLSVMVHPLARRSGLGMRLLASGEALARESGTRRLVAVHSSRMQARQAFERLLAVCGWRPPQELEFRLAGRAAWAERAKHDWAGFLQRLADRGFGTTSWRDMDDAEWAKARRVAHELPEADRAFDPFSRNIGVTPLADLSIVLRREERIVGWIVGSRGALADSFHYSQGYALPEVRRLGWLAAGARDVCERQAKLHGAASLSVFETSQGNTAMRRFMERQLEPYSEWTDSRYVSEKELQP
ncbi:MAG TPA: GNAT family N-acetyltransferase [Ramlibacter sp.]|uniref:GNAT family N-acetyltransferase n=1 Tax=Ramlibacter sp. TaxID=1917967 RepID=UPI002B658622|nr:GNAT family N-acetyltransferase [Ramlibacter sp.]HVZ43763.1 GNAT family N-acetyltransferase [Ramlibacter sp.]